VSKSKNQNAVKHGAFAKVVILPGENVKEFEAIHQALINEWKPDGPAELDAVCTLAKCFWRKARLARYQQNEVATWEEESESRRRGPIGRDIEMLFSFLENVESGSLGAVTEENLATKLAAPWPGFYKIHSPRTDYDSDSAWLAAIVDDIKNFKKTRTPVLREMKCSDHKKVEEVFCSGERMGRELALEERIDTMIDKTIKRICQIKTAKEVVAGLQHASVKNEALKQVESSPIYIVEDKEYNQ